MVKHHLSKLYTEANKAAHLAAAHFWPHDQCDYHCYTRDPPSKGGEWKEAVRCEVLLDCVLQLFLHVKNYGSCCQVV